MFKSAGLGVVVLILVLTGCSGEADGPAAAGSAQTPAGTSVADGSQAAGPTSTGSESGPESTGSASTAASSASSGTVVSGAAYRFTIPKGLSYKLFDDQVRPQDGLHLRQWRFSPTSKAPYCVIQAVEQPGYQGEFPKQALEVFRSRRQPEDLVVRNESIAPPSGAVAAVAQELTGPQKQAGGTTITSHTYQRQVLTPGRTLLQLTVTLPEKQISACRPQQIVASLVPTGKEAQAVSAAN